jgi:DNA-binding Lrp family transcriptional regulator
MVRREEIDEAILKVVRAYPGLTASTIVPMIAGRLGVSEERVRERLKRLVEGGKIVLRHVNFYPVDDGTFETDNLSEIGTLDRLIHGNEDAKGAMESLLSQEVKPRTDGENGTSGVRFLLIYDLKPEVPAAVRRVAYYRLNEAISAIRREGRRVERRWPSIIVTETKEDAEKLASCLPRDGATVEIFKVLKE